MRHRADRCRTSASCLGQRDSRPVDHRDGSRSSHRSPGCWRRSQLRSPRRRHRPLLGQQQPRSGHRARRHVQHPRRRRRPHVRPAHQRHRHLLGQTTASARPPRPPAPSPRLTAGNGHTCGVRTNGTATCWGYNGHGQATAPTGTFTTLTAGSLHTCGLRTNGTAVCWGNNDGGQATSPAGTFTTLSAGRLAHVRRPHQRHRHLLGLQQLRPDHRPRRHLHQPRCGLRPHLRPAHQRHRHLLGRQLLRPDHRPQRHFRHRRRRVQPHLRHPFERHRHLLGRQRQRPVR